MSGELAVQGALYAALSALGLNVVDRAGQAADGGSTTPFPYVEVGFIQMNPFDTARETGFEYLARIHVRSRSGGMAEGKEILRRIYLRLHRGALSVAGFNHILIQFESGPEPIVAQDGALHMVAEYRGLIEAI